jgi:PPOX class probable F420-dependent enzyme
MRAYLDAREEWAVLTTIDEDGYPHSVALGYYRIGEDLFVGTPARTRKVRNLERNPRASLLVARSKASGDWSGVLTQGDVAIIREPAERLRIEREGLRQRGKAEHELPSEPRKGEVILRLTPRRTVSWRFN